MTPATQAYGSRAPRGLAIVLLGVLLAACSPAASVAPSATPVATPAPTASPTAAATVAATPSPSAMAAASGSAQPDPAIGLKIAAPYKLTALDPALEATFREQFTQGAGAFGSLLGVGGRTVTKDDKLVGYVFVIGFPASTLTPTTWQAMLTGMQGSMGVTFTTEKIAGVDVATGSSAAANVGVMQDGDHLVLMLTPTTAELPTVAKALIDANK